MRPCPRRPDPTSGRAVPRFGRRPLAGFLVSLALCACAGDATTADPDSGDPKSAATGGTPPASVVFVSIDTLRADHLGCYGYFRDTSPRIDALADESIVFERCISPMATTLPSHVTMFTGTWPIEHGILANYRYTGIPYRPSERIQSLASFLTEQGYATAGFVSALPLKSHFGMAVGFEHFDDPEETQRPAGGTTDVALEWLAGVEEGPFFLWVHYFDPHIPYEPPQPWDTRFTQTPELDEHLATRRFTAEAERTTGGTHHAVEGMNLYDGEVAYTDHELGRLLDALSARADWENTIVVLVGDHGEGLNQHGEPGHGLTWEEHLHVPFLMRVPGAEARRVATPVSLADVLPTLLGRLGLDAAALLEQASGVDVLDDAFVPRAVLSQSSQRQQRYETPATFTLTEGRWKYARVEDGTQLLFDLERDPFELENVVAAHPDVAQRMGAALDELLATQRERGAYFGQGRLEAQDRHAERLKRRAAEQALSDEELEAMRALGYGGGGEDE